MANKCFNYTYWHVKWAAYNEYRQGMRLIPCIASVLQVTLSVLQAVYEPVEVCPQLPGSGQWQISWYSYSVSQV